MIFYCCIASNREPERHSQFAPLIPHIMKKETSSSSIGREKPVESIKLIPTTEYQIIEETVKPVALLDRKESSNVFKEDKNAAIENSLYKQTTITFNLPKVEEKPKQTPPSTTLKQETSQPFLDPRQPSFVNREKSK